jgi:hypothetical protein
MKNVCQNSWSLGRDLNAGPPKSGFGTMVGFCGDDNELVDCNTRGFVY